MSNAPRRDQSNNNLALKKLQFFIDEYPDSEFLEDSESYISILRLKKAQKIYETARLYLKLKEYDYDGVFLERGKCIIIDKDEVIKFCNSNNIFIKNSRQKFVDRNKI